MTSNPRAANTRLFASSKHCSLTRPQADRIEPAFNQCSKYALWVYVCKSEPIYSLQPTWHCVFTMSHPSVACRLLGIINAQVGDLSGIAALYHTRTRYSKACSPLFLCIDWWEIRENQTAQWFLNAKSFLPYQTPKKWCVYLWLRDPNLQKALMIGPKTYTVPDDNYLDFLTSNNIAF